MKILKYNYFLLIIASMLVVSCTDNYEAINKNIQGASEDEVNRDEYMTRSYFQAMQDHAIPVSPHQAQFIECSMGGSYGGYFADSNPGFNNRNFATYIPEDAWISPLFKDIMPQIMSNYNYVLTSSNSETLHKAALIIKVFGMHRITDTYGPIPYSKVGVDGVIQAPYDSQEQIYMKMLEELDDAIDYLTAHQTDNFYAKADLVYGGNVINWIKFGNSLKLRLAMRLTNVKPDLAKQKAEEVANHPIGAITANADNATKPVVGINPFYTVVVDWNGGDSRISADITSYMNGYNDPRREQYFTKSNFKESAMQSNGFYGLRSGIEIPNREGVDNDGNDVLLVRSYSNMKVETKSELLWMNAAETAFLKAEGAMRGWDMGGTAEHFYNEGIKLSFEQWNASGADAYLSDAGSTPGGYVDPLGFFSYNGTTSSITIKWDEIADNEEKLERIITQKWIANFPLGNEAWADYRRTGYPFLMPVVVNNSGGAVSSLRMARRIPYPQIEYTGNTENLNSAINQYLGGPDNMGTDLWWAKKN